MTQTPANSIESPATGGDSLARVIEAVRLAAGLDPGQRVYPPVERWNPADCGDIGLEIRADGSWWHAGTRFGRQPLIELFASVLRKDEDGSTWLVTPYEKVPVKVADAHFIAIRADRHGAGESQLITLTTNTGDTFALDQDHPLTVKVDLATREPRPYVRVRGRLDALLTRAAFYELVSWGEEREGVYGVVSAGQFFVIDATR